MCSLPSINFLLSKLAIQTPIIGVYDSPKSDLFEPLYTPVASKRTCMFAFYNAWKKGRTLELSKYNFGCGGCGYWWFGKESRTREQLLSF